MAINMIATSRDSSACSSPRISFSHDLPDSNPTQSHHQQQEQEELDSILLRSSTDFNFCVIDERKTETCHADELFFNGVIIPTLMKERLNTTTTTTNNNSKSSTKDQDVEITSTTTASLVRQESKSTSKSFWRFKRSSSLNCDNNYKNLASHSKKSSIWSLPLLLRSKSTGSATNHCKSIKSSNVLPPQQKAPLRKNNTNINSNGGYHNYGSHRNTGSNNNCGVLNVPPPYIAKGTSDLLGLGGLFRNSSKDKKMIRK